MKKSFNGILRNLLGVALCFNSLTAQATVPATHIKGVDELFIEEYKQYSPILGLIHHRNFVTKIHKLENDEGSALSKLSKRLFTEVPGGEVVPTHMPKNPPSHLSAAAIAKFFTAFEHAKKLGSSTNNPQSPEQIREFLIGSFATILRQDQKYQASLEIGQIKSAEARAAYEAFPKRLQEAEEVQKTKITPLDRQITKMKAALKKEGKDSSPELLQALEDRVVWRTLCENMRKDLYAPNKKDADKRLKYELESNDTLGVAYQASVQEFISTLADSFMSHELKGVGKVEVQNATTLSLLSFLWLKFTTKADLQDYLVELAGQNALQPDLWASLSADFFTSYYTEENLLELKRQFSGAWRKERWVKNHFADAVSIGLDNSGLAKLPSVVTFNYFNWGASFPDCCENALHNLFNLIAFDPKTGNYSPELLRELKNKYYPKLSEKLIAYYETHRTAEDHVASNAAAEWVQVVSGLNEGIENQSKEQEIHYRRKDSHIASPYSNLVKVVGRMFGYEDVTQDHMAEIFSHVSEVTGFEIQYSNSEVDAEGFGTAQFKAGKDLFSLDAYRPVHVGFWLKKDNDNQIVKNVAQIFADLNTNTASSSVSQLRYYSAASLFF
jgi:hypothetical protein